MAQRTWNGTTGLFETQADWLENAVPVPGDVALIQSGTVTLTGSRQPQPGNYDGLAIVLGSTVAAAPAQLVLDNAVAGPRTSLALAGNMPETLSSIGASGFQGTIGLTAGNSLTIAATAADGPKPPDFVLLDGGMITASDGATLTTLGRIDNEGSIDIGFGATLNVVGTLETISGTLTVGTQSTVTGSGALAIGMAGYVTIAGANPTSVAVRFDGPGGVLELGGQQGFNGTISGFRSGDIVAVDNFRADYADIEGGKLTLKQGGSGGAILQQIPLLDSAADGPLPFSAGGGQIIIGAPPSPLFNTADGAQAATAIGAADHALRSDVVRATLLNGKPIDGTGIRIGILSDSFNAAGGDRPNLEAQTGFLPLAADGTTCAVNVLQDDPSGRDEGRAIAELIHRIAPGASIDFYAAQQQGALGPGITALTKAGCNIIVDDLVEAAGNPVPFFQTGSAVDTSIGVEPAITAAVAAGVSYFTSAGNAGAQSFQGTFNTAHAQTTLYDGTTEDAYVFGNGTAYQTLAFQAADAVTLTLQWDTPFPASLPRNAPAALQVEVFDSTHTRVATSTQSTFYDPTTGTTSTLPQETVSFTVPGPADYQIAIFSPTGAALPGTFKYLLSGPSGTGEFDRNVVIADPAADQGSGVILGHQLLPIVNTVGAADFANTPAYGKQSGFVDDYSDAGPGVALFDASGQPIAPVSLGKPDFVAPSGVDTTVASFAPFFGTSSASPEAAAVAALMLQVNPSLTPSQVTAILKASAIDLGEPAVLQGAGLIQADTAVAMAEVACFAAGTRIATPDGPVPVERLRIGDAVKVAAGGARRVTWVGRRRIDCARHERPEHVWPIQVRAGAFADGAPARDLLLSGDHAVFVDDVLIPIKYLVNGTSIRRSRVAAVTYVHIALDRHDVVLAEGLPAESYLHAAGRVVPGSGDPLPSAAETCGRVWEALGCAPLVVTGKSLDRVRQRLALRAAMIGGRPGCDATRARPADRPGLVRPPADARMTACGPAI